MKQKRLIFFLFIVSVFVFTHPGAARADSPPPADTTIAPAVIGGDRMVFVAGPFVAAQPYVLP